jgi:hypothetical protein
LDHLVIGRTSRFVVAHASVLSRVPLATWAIQQVNQRSGGRPFRWCGDGWRPYPRVI